MLSMMNKKKEPLVGDIVFWTVSMEHLNNDRIQWGVIYNIEEYKQQILEYNLYICPLLSIYLINDCLPMSVNRTITKYCSDIITIYNPLIHTINQ